MLLQQAVVAAERTPATKDPLPRAEDRTLELAIPPQQPAVGQAPKPAAAAVPSRAAAPAPLVAPAVVPPPAAPVAPPTVVVSRAAERIQVVVTPPASEPTRYEDTETPAPLTAIPTVRSPASALIVFVTIALVVGLASAGAVTVLRRLLGGP